MKKVFIVTKGCYSDYHIVAVFDSAELANAFKNSFSKSEYSDEIYVEEFTINPHKESLNNHYKPFFVRMKKNGECLECRESGTYGFEEESDRCQFDVNFNMYTHAFAKDKEHAIKIANERRAQLIALDRWSS